MQIYQNMLTLTLNHAINYWFGFTGFQYTQIWKYIWNQCIIIVEWGGKTQALGAAWWSRNIHATQIHWCFLFGQSFPRGELLFELAAGGFWGTGPQLCSPLCVLLQWNFLSEFFLWVSMVFCDWLSCDAVC